MESFAFVGVPIWPSAVVGVRASAPAARQSPTTSSVPALIAAAQYVVGVANAANPKHNTQQRQSVGFVNSTASSASQLPAPTRFT